MIAQRFQLQWGRTDQSVVSSDSRFGGSDVGGAGIQL